MENHQVLQQDVRIHYGPQHKGSNSRESRGGDLRFSSYNQAIKKLAVSFK